MENRAPIIGPMMNPTENAMPTNAMAFPRFFKSDTSVMMAMLSEMLPLLRPPTNRASTKMKKFDDSAQSTYDSEIPACKPMKFNLVEMKLKSKIDKN